MSTLFKATIGDTFDLIARRVYGDELSAYLIREANPGVTDPILGGLVLTIPDLPDLRPDLSNVPSNETGILIDGKRFKGWESVRIVRSIDAMDTIEFTAPFESDDGNFRKTFKPLSFKSCVFFVDGSPLFTGTAVSVTPNLEPNRKAVEVGGYSLPGVLNDCTVPPSAYPAEFDGLDLVQIADRLVRPFGLGILILNDIGSIFERVACEPSKKVLSFLIELAQERGLIVSSSTDGSLTFSKSSEAGAPVAILKQGESPLISVTPTFSPQEYYSTVTGIEPVVFGLEGSRHTIRNPHLEGIFRPYAFIAQDTEDADVPQLVEAKAGRMFANVATYSANVATWRDPQGDLWEPNTTLKLLAPDAMVYSEYEFLIRSVTFERGPDSETATLELVFPESFRGELPERMPWED